MKKALAMILCAAMVALLVGAAVAEGSITVKGTGVVHTNADRATIIIGVREVSADVREAQAAVNERISGIIESLVEKGIARKDISTDSIGIYPNYDYSSDIELIVSYTAYNSISVVTADIDNAGYYIDTAFEAGANSLDSVQFSVADTTSAGNEALTLAVSDATKKAQVLAEAAGMQLGGILSIQEEYGNDYSLPYMYATSEEANADKGTEILASRMQVSATVSVEFEMVREN